MNFGECVRSLRPLLRRSNLVEVNLDSAVSGSSVMMLTQHTFGKYPLYYGYDPAGVHSAKGTLVPLSNFAFNYVQPTPYHWIAPAFIAQKGAGMWHFNIDNVNPIASVAVVRANQFNLLAGETKAGQAAGTVSANARFFLSSYPQTSGGVSLTSQYTNAGLSVSCPNYTNYKFQSTRPQNTSQPSTVPSASAYDGSDRDTYKLLITTSELTTQVASNTMKIWKYFGVGTDYSLYYFLNVPTFLRLPAIPTAN
jgi:hypothetical protein